MNTSTLVRPLAGLAVIATLLCAGCSGDAPASEESSPPQTVVTHNQSIFAFESLDYVISYAHQVSTFSVVDEEDSPERDESAEGYRPRIVQVEFTDNLWVSPGKDAAEHAEFYAFGSTTHVDDDGGTVTRIAVPENGPRLEVGKDYVAAFVMYENDGLAPMSPDATFELVGKSLMDSKRYPEHSRALAGLSLSELSERLQQATLLPAVVDHMDVEYGDVRLYESSHAR